MLNRARSISTDGSVGGQQVKETRFSCLGCRWVICFCLLAWGCSTTVHVGSLESEDSVPGLLSDSLFVAQPTEVRFVDVASEVGLGYQGPAYAAAAADYDGGRLG